jgi:carboxymethylenebutenolidase
MRRTTLTSADGFELGAYTASPSAVPRGGIVVVQEIFGVNAHIRQVVDGFACDGYAVLAPQIFDRIERDVELGYSVKADWDHGIDLAFNRFDRVSGLQDIAAAVRKVAAHGKVGLVGYCFGGLLAWLSACEIEGLSAVSSYYGGSIVKELHRTARCPVMMHIGDNDGGIPMTEIDAIRLAKPDVVMHVYPGAGHGFNCDQRDSYDAASARLARTRTLGFFGRHLD